MLYSDAYFAGYRGDTKPEDWMDTSTYADMYCIGKHDQEREIRPIVPAPSRGQTYRQGLRVVTVERGAVIYIR